MKIAFIDDDDEFIPFWKNNFFSHELVFQNDLNFFVKKYNILSFDYIISDFYFFDYNFYDVFESNYLQSFDFKNKNIFIFSDAAKKIPKKQFVKYIFGKNQAEGIVKIIWRDLKKKQNYV